MTKIVAMSPFDCRMWAMHDRLESNVNEASCRSEIESVLKNGQLVPALGRPLRGDPTHKVELIYGARRLFVARHLNKPILVEVREISDREAIVAMDVENRLRVDISPYERGMSYSKWLRAGYFGCQEDMARALSVSASQVSRLLRIAHLPSVIVDAFGKASEICEGWALEIMDALEVPHHRQSTLQVARTLVALPRLPAREVYQRLLGAAQPGRRVRSRAHDEVVKDENDRPMFRVRYQSSGVALIIPLARLSEQLLEDLRASVKGVLEQGRAPITRVNGASVKTLNSAA